MQPDEPIDQSFPHVREGRGSYTAAAQALHGRRALVTRTLEQAGDLADALRGLGADVIETPLIRFAPIGDTVHLDRALRTLPSFNWAVFTSANAVRAVFSRMAALGIAAEVPRGCRFVAIGPATARALESQGVAPHLVPPQHDAAALADALLQARRGRVLLPQSDLADGTLAARLGAAGFDVSAVTAYRTLIRQDQAKRAAHIVRNGDVEIVTFASPSAVKALKAALGEDAAHALAGTLVACIGPSTAAAARHHGVDVNVVSPRPNAASLAGAIAEYCSNGQVRRP